MNYNACPTGVVRHTEELKTKKTCKASENIPLNIYYTWSIQMMIVLYTGLMEPEKNPDRKDQEYKYYLMVCT